LTSLEPYYFPAGVESVRELHQYHPNKPHDCVDKSYGVFATFVLAMLRHPDVQLKAQAEIDNVVGQSRFPTITDKNQLPYVNAVIKESLRWGPPVPIGA
jgi:hypothetical protein